MGRHYSDDENYSRSRKKKKRRSRSRSRSSSSDSRSYRSSKSKKLSRRRHSRSRSRSTERSRRKKYRDSRSRSRERRSGSRSYSRRSYSRSRSRSPKYRRDRSRSRSRTPRRRRRRSRSRSLSSTRSSRRGKGDSRGSSQVKVEPGESLAPGKQTELQIQMALKAAAAADEKLKEAGLLPKGIGRSADFVTLSLKEQHDRISAIETIEEEGFEAAHFSSSRQQKAAHSQNDNSVQATHENAIFSAQPLEIKQDTAPKTKITGSIMHPNFYVPVEEKMARWRKKLIDMRNKKLEGEAM